MGGRYQTTDTRLRDHYHLRGHPRCRSSSLTERKPSGRYMFNEPSALLRCPPLPIPFLLPASYLSHVFRFLGVIPALIAPVVLFVFIASHPVPPFFGSRYHRPFRYIYLRHLRDHLLPPRSTLCVLTHVFHSPWFSSCNCAHRGRCGSVRLFRTEIQIGSIGTCYHFY